MSKNFRIFGISALGCLGACLLYVASWILYFVNYRESDVSDQGYHSTVYVIYIAAGLWAIFIGRWLFKIIARKATPAEQVALPAHERQRK